MYSCTEDWQHVAATAVTGETTRKSTVYSMPLYQLDASGQRHQKHIHHIYPTKCRQGGSHAMNLTIFAIESTKTTSMETVSTGVLEK